jgi:hypothetical protein
MISPSLHPDAIKAACERRRKLAFGLTPCGMGLVAAGFLLLLPGFYFEPLSYGTVESVGLVLLAAVAVPRQ